MNDPDPPHDPFQYLAPRFSDYYPDDARETIEFIFSRKLILGTRRWIQYIDRAIQRATGQTRARWQTLHAISFSEPPVTTVMLAERLGVRWPTLVRTLGNLEADGLIEKIENPEDGRSRIIQLTDKGHDVFRKTKAVLDPERHRVLAELSDAELIAATAAVDRFLAAIHREAGPADPE